MERGRENGGKRVNCDMDGLIKFPEDSIDDPADGLREVTNQWIMDSNEYVASREPPSSGVFSDWNVGQRPVEGNAFDEPPGGNDMGCLCCQLEGFQEAEGVRQRWSCQILLNIWVMGFGQLRTSPII